MFKSLSKKIAIDLGAATIRLLMIDEQNTQAWESINSDWSTRVIEEAACVARQKASGKIIAVGQAALAMRGRLEKEVEIIFPFVESRLIDKEAAIFLLNNLLKRAFNQYLVIQPEVMVVSAAQISDLDKQLLTELFDELGFSKIYLVAAPLAAAIGAGVPVADASGACLLHMGASCVEAAVIGLGSVLFLTHSNQAGQWLDKEIIEFLQQGENLLIGCEAASQLKQTLLNLDFDNISPAKLEVVGQTAKQHLPQSLHVKSKDLEPIAVLARQEYTTLVEALLQRIPPDLSVDILHKGLLLTGGLAKTQGLEVFLSQHFKFPVARMEDAAQLAIIGAATLLANIKLFEGRLEYGK
jgi:rod shape-determining protein MreB